MKIVIPMAGLGKRFLAAGYKTPKPLIEVDGKPIIQHVVEKFSPNKDQFLFGINEEHIKSHSMDTYVRSLVKNAEFVAMPYQQAGPIGVLNHLFPKLRQDEPVVVNYCDFSWAWDYTDFKNKMRETNCDGAVVCYKGFHPHLLGPNLYATLDAEGLWMKEIREKHSWFDRKEKDWTSSGTYYFKSSKILEECCRAIERHPDWKINDEFYVSQLYQVMKEKGLNIYIYEIPFMLQWGTPEDLEEYVYWSDYFHKKESLLAFEKEYDMTSLVLMAGAGKRFAEAGYTAPKPFIPVDEKPMVVSSTKSLPHAKENLFITRKEVLSDAQGLDIKTKAYFDHAEMMCIDYLTEGQACTALLSKEKIKHEKPLLIEACDHGILYDENRFEKAIQPKSGIDALVLSFRNFPPVRRNPQAYGWIDAAENGKVKRVSVKIPLEGNPAHHHAIIGSFWFRKASIFFECAEDMIRANSRINGEFYIDEVLNFLIKKDYNVHVFEVDKYVSWGTPDDLRTYEYWQNYFQEQNVLELDKEK